MGTTNLYRPSFAAFVLSATFAASLVSAQIPGGPSPEVRMRQDGPIREVTYTDAPMRPQGKSRSGPGVVSADLLRHPITEKARRMLQKALESMKAGNHEAAIEQLLETLAKFPDSAAYTHSLLGVEYLRTGQFTASVSSLEQAALLLPHDAVTRYNFGLSLVCAGEYDRGEQEVRRALELDPKNPTMQALFSALLQNKRSSD
jgi:Flp pilus assembly protein TadD